MAADSAQFTPASLRFLRDLARNNDRAWFNERKAVYEQELKAPMLAVVEAINGELASFAPDHVRPPARAVMRIYRDTRFSKEKIPYKTHMAAWWARTGMEKTSGAGFYLQVGADEILLAAGCYMPERDQLLAIRRHLLEHHGEMRALLGDRRLRKLAEPFEGLPLTRAPKGFEPWHPAMDLVMQRQWGVSRRLPSSFAMGMELGKVAGESFRAMAPLVAFLNLPLAPTAKDAVRASFGF